MQNNVKKVFIILPIIFFLCFSFIGITVNAATRTNQNEEKSTSSSTNIDGASTNENETNSTKNKNTETTNSGSSIQASGSTSISGPNISGPSPSDPDAKNQDSSTAKNEDAALIENLPAWRNIDGKLHYVTEKGIVQKTGWFKEKDENHNANNDNQYYLDKDHAATLGWKEIEESWYYFNEAGIKQTGWILINYNWYHLNKDGIMEKGWIEDSGNKYYLNDEGIKSIGKKYIEDNWYFFGTDGALQTGLYDNSGKLYYSTKDGIMGANEWIKTSNSNKYYIKADSSVATGDAIIDNIMEKFNTDGKYIGAGQMEDHLFVKYLNVGDADCAFIKLPNGETALIDTGTVETSEKLVSFLNEQDLKKEDGKGVIDYIIITHAHSDHIGGLASVLDNFKVGKVYMPDIAVMKDWYSNVKVTAENSASVEMMKTDYKVYNDSVKAMKDKKIEFTNTKKGEFIDKNNILQFLESDKNFGPIGSEKITENYWGINENSAIVYLNYGDLQSLFAADMEWNSEKDFEVNNLLEGKTVDVLKVPHHGHDTSSTVDFIRYLKPTIGIISRSQESIEKNIAYTNLVSNKVSVYETSAKDGVSIYANQENWTMQS